VAKSPETYLPTEPAVKSVGKDGERYNKDFP